MPCEQNWFDRLYEWAIDCYPYDPQFPEKESKPTNFIAPIILTIVAFEGDIIQKSKRIICALRGCDIKSSGYGGGGYLPDDCWEWWCDRCGAEGMNYSHHNYREFYGDDKLTAFIEALKGK